MDQVVGQQLAGAGPQPAAELPGVGGDLHGAEQPHGDRRLGLAVLGGQPGWVVGCRNTRRVGNRHWLGGGCGPGRLLSRRWAVPVAGFDDRIKNVIVGPGAANTPTSSAASAWVSAQARAPTSCWTPSSQGVAVCTRPVSSSTSWAPPSTAVPGSSAPTPRRAPWARIAASRPACSSETPSATNTSAGRGSSGCSRRWVAKSGASLASSSRARCTSSASSTCSAPARPAARRSPGKPRRRG